MKALVSSVHPLPQFVMKEKSNIRSLVTGFIGLVLKQSFRSLNHMSFRLLNHIRSCSYLICIVACSGRISLFDL